MMGFFCNRHLVLGSAGLGVSVGAYAVGGAAFGIGAAASNSLILGIGNGAFFGDHYDANDFGRDLLYGGAGGAILGLGAGLANRFTFAIDKVDIARLNALGKEMPTPGNTGAYGTKGEMGFEPLTDLPEVKITSSGQTVTPTSGSASNPFTVTKDGVVLNKDSYIPYHFE